MIWTSHAYDGGVGMEEKTLKIYDSENVGEVQITEDVIAIIAGLAATEVDGVYSMAGGITNELVSMLGRKNLSAGVEIECGDGAVSVAISLIIKYGYTVPDVTGRVQENVANAIKNMTGLEVTKVDINVTNVNIEQ